MKKSVIITGAAGNLGQAVTKKFLELGYAVFAIISNKDNPGFLNAPDLYIFPANLMYEPDAANTIKQIEGEAGNIDLAVLTVGGFSMGTFAETSLEDFEKMYRLNFVTAYNVARPVFSIMEGQKGGGQLIFIGARPAVVPSQAKNMLAYAMSKSLIFKLSEIINEDGEDKNIRSAVIVPGIIDTPQNRKNMPGADFSRWVKPDNIAENIAWLVTPSGMKLRETVLKVYGDL